MKKIFTILALLVGSVLSGYAATYIVTNTNDSGAGSLRQAITDANANAGADIINFNIAGTGPFTISPTSALPSISGTVTIDALTQPGASAGSPNIVLNGASAGVNANGLTISAGANNSIIKGLVINGFTGAGIYISGTNNSVVSCFIGTNITGTLSVGNKQGIYISGMNNIIGGSTSGDRNVISGNDDGINISGVNASGNILKGNYIGIDVTGSVGLGNTGDIFLNGATNTIIGGSTLNERNVISGSPYYNIQLFQNVKNTVIKGNYIGTNAAGTASLAPSGSASAGIYVGQTSSNTVVGGVGTGEGNLIKGNSFSGIFIESPSVVTIRGNSIFENGGLGMDYIRNNIYGVTLNNTDGVQNFPLITGAYKNAVVGTFNSTPSSTFTLDFYSNTTADASGYGEGEVYLGSTTVTTDGSGNATYSFAGTFTAGKIISATATSATGSTSEFGLNQTVQDALPVSLLSFKATATKNNRQALLEWITSVEINNDRFEVERSANALDWKKLSTLSGKGNNTERAYYTYTDESPLLNTSYYRLKQIDFDGTYTYSQIKALSFEEELSSALTAYPNPTSGTVTIILNELIEVQRVGLYNLSGSQLKGNTQSLSPNKVSVDLSNLPTGTYLVNYGNKSVKIIRQ